MSAKYNFQGDRKSTPIRINLPPSPTASVGARAADEGLGGPLWSPVSCSSSFHLGGTRPYLAPTDRPASCLNRRVLQIHVAGGKIKFTVVHPAMFKLAPGDIAVAPITRRLINAENHV